MTLRTSTLQGIELHLTLAKIGAGGKPLVGDSLRTLAPHEKNLSIFDSDSNKALRTHWDGNQLRFMRFPPVGIIHSLSANRFLSENRIVFGSCFLLRLIVH